MVKKNVFNVKLSLVSMLKVFISTTLGPFVGAKIMLDSSFADAFIVAIFSGLIMSGLQFANALNRYERDLANGR